ncbi:YbaN family protein [Dokdonella sp.]|uniref:YbaN family protein n=1 Tax=Dokdonella sp. TaxID=2291710 RepID=UPI003AF85D71
MPAPPAPNPDSASPARVDADVAAPLPLRTRLAWWLLAYLSLGLGLLGVLLPVMPTVPFILLAAFAASRGSPRLRRRLLAHPQFGTAIRDWERHGAVSRRAKWLATASMAAGAVVQVIISPLASIFGISCMALVTFWLWRRPEPQPRFDS